MQSNCSVYPCISLLLSGHVEKSPVLSGLMLPLCRSFLSNSSEAESLSTERIPNQIPFYSSLPELLTQNHTALQHTNICQHPSTHSSLFPSLPLSLSSRWSSIHHPSSPSPRSSFLFFSSIHQQHCL